jgi:hypothetical protein
MDTGAGRRCWPRTGSPGVRTRERPPGSVLSDELADHELGAVFQRHRDWLAGPVPVVRAACVGAASCQRGGPGRLTPSWPGPSEAAGAPGHRRRISHTKWGNSGTRRSPDLPGPVQTGVPPCQCAISELPCPFVFRTCLTFLRDHLPSVWFGPEMRERASWISRCWRSSATGQCVRCWVGAGWRGRRADVHASRAVAFHEIVTGAI